MHILQEHKHTPGSSIVCAFQPLSCYFVGVSKHTCTGCQGVQHLRFDHCLLNSRCNTLCYYTLFRQNITDSGQDQIKLGASSMWNASLKAVLTKVMCYPSMQVRNFLLPAEKGIPGPVGVEISYCLAQGVSQLLLSGKVLLQCLLQQLWVNPSVHIIFSLRICNHGSYT